MRGMRRPWSRFADQTRGILTSVSEACPGCHHPNVAYVTVAGKWIQGSGLLQSGASVLQRVAGASYQQVCGRADVWCVGSAPTISRLT